MSSCSDNSCGIGGFGGPLPGDPDNNLVLSATPAFGGIDVSWSWPAQNPHAVAHVLLYRGLLETFDGAIRHAVVAGDIYYDRIPNEIRYYYWIQVVSVNGTVGELIGPATAVARPSISQTIEELTGMIDAGLLAQSLKERLDKIVLIDQALAQEVISRQNAEVTLAEALAAADVKSSQALTFVFKEVQDRTTANSAIVNAIDLQAATFDGKVALAKSQVLTSVDEKTGVLSQRIDDVSASANGSVAQVRTDMQAKIDVLTGNVSTLNTSKASASDLVGVQTTLQANINGVTGAVNAMYTAKVDVNGLVGGFGLANNGEAVEAGFDVDRFWIGRTTSKKKPFIVQGNEVFINEAVIEKLVFEKLRAADGSVVIENGKLKATSISASTLSSLSATIGLLRTAASGARTEIADNVIKVFDAANGLRVKMGNLDL